MLSEHLPMVLASAKIYGEDSSKAQEMAKQEIEESIREEVKVRKKSVIFTKPLLSLFFRTSKMTLNVTQ